MHHQRNQLVDACCLCAVSPYSSFVVESLAAVPAPAPVVGCAPDPRNNDRRLKSSCGIYGRQFGLGHVSRPAQDDTAGVDHSTAQRCAVNGLAGLRRARTAPNVSPRRLHPGSRQPATSRRSTTHPPTLARDAAQEAATLAIAPLLWIRLAAAARAGARLERHRTRASWCGRRRARALTSSAGEPSLLPARATRAHPHGAPQ